MKRKKTLMKRKKREKENLTKDTPPKKGFGLPLCLSGTFSTHLSWRCSVLLVQSPRLSTPEALLEGSNNFLGGSVVRYVFLPPCVLHSPCHGPASNTQVLARVSKGYLAGPRCQRFDRTLSVVLKCSSH